MGAVLVFASPLVGAVLRVSIPTFLCSGETLWRRPPFFWCALLSGALNADPSGHQAVMCFADAWRVTHARRRLVLSGRGRRGPVSAMRVCVADNWRVTHARRRRFFF